MDELERNHEYSIGTDSIRALIDVYNENIMNKIKSAFSDYVRSEGCTCCRDIDAHDEAADRLGELLGFEKYEDSFGYNFNK